MIINNNCTNCRRLHEILGLGLLVWVCIFTLLLYIRIGKNMYGNIKKGFSFRSRVNENI